MSKFLKYFIICLISFYSADVFAMKSGYGSSILKKLVVDSIPQADLCFVGRDGSTPNPIASSQEDYPCIGTTRSDSGQCMGNTTPCYGDEWGVNMMVAIDAGDTVKNGLKFCPRSVVARNSNNTSSWTQYHATSGGDCHILCKPGWKGEKCDEEDTSSRQTLCDPSSLSPDNYKNLGVANVCNTYNLEDYVLNWWANWFKNCNGWHGKEHDLIVAIADWTNSGHGAWIRPYVIMANQNDARYNDSWINIGYGKAADGKPIPRQLWCKRGYKLNADKTDCVAINSDICNAKWCEGWAQSDFDSKASSLNTDSGCLQWRCTDATYALDKAGGKTCSACISSRQDGVNPTNGTCVHCESDKMFSAEAVNSGYCVNTVKLSKSQLKYGLKGSKNDEIGKQCWTLEKNTDYKQCVLTGEIPTTNSDSE